ncbi:MAG: AraC family transcriptional regulator [Pseudomonadota bacterium]
MRESIDHTVPIAIDPSQILIGEGPPEFMRERAAVMYDMTPLHAPHNSGVYRTQNWFAGGLMFVSIKQDPSAVGRSRAQAENGAGLVFIHRYVYGGIRGVMGDLNIDRDPDQVYLMDQERRVNCLQFANAVHGVFIPKDRIGYHPDRHAPFIRFSNHRVLGALLNQAFCRVFQDILAHDQINLVALDRLLACLKTALQTDPRDGDVRRQARDALADLIRTYVERNLDHPDLSSTLILKNFGVSRASLFRMFERDGGVRNFIKQRRVFRAVLDIAGTPNVRGAISSAAERWGFSSNSSFNRAVRDQFGMPPGALVGLPLRELRYQNLTKKFYEFTQQA